MLSTHSPRHAPRHVCLMAIDDVNVRGRASSRTEEKGGGEYLTSFGVEVSH